MRIAAENPVFRPIATLYAGVDFRSRVEAKWAALFDIVGWRWTYEPVDLAGYIPDFFLHFDRGDVLFECKPDKRSDDLRSHAGKIARSGWRRDFVIGGPCMLAPRIAPGVATLGAMGQWLPGEGDDGGFIMGEALMHRCLACGRLSFHHDEGSWRCAQCGADGRRLIEPVLVDGAQASWREAGNRVQWMGRAVTP